MPQHHRDLFHMYDLDLSFYLYWNLTSKKGWIFKSHFMKHQNSTNLFRICILKVLEKISTYSKSLSLSFYYNLDFKLKNSLLNNKSSKNDKCIVNLLASSYCKVI